MSILTGMVVPPWLNLRVIVAGLLFLTIGFQAVALYGAKHQRDVAVAKLATASQEADRLVEAAQGSERTIVQLQAANKALVDALASQQQALDEAAAELEPLKQLAEAQARALRERERIDRATPKCQFVLNTDLGGACPALADGVRQRANRRLPGSTG